MPSTGNQTVDYALYAFVGLVLLFLGYRIGRMIGTLASSKLIASKEQELFTAQKGFKNLYEQEISNLKSENSKLNEQLRLLNERVEEYRKKAAGFGGLFSGSSKRADAMYALLLENEALEEALYAQNEKLKQERTDALKDQLRATSYRRVLMSQLLNDERIKGYVAEILADEKHLPGPTNSDQAQQPALPATSSTSGEAHPT
jgi:predicted lactoylglutathione lyase